MKIFYLSLLFLFTSLILSSCKKNPVIPHSDTIDTTSHNFNFQTWRFGEHSSSTLYDVAIIDENNIWAVGEIYLNDSTGQPDPMPYNAIQWNGIQWQPSTTSQPKPSSLASELSKYAKTTPGSFVAGGDIKVT